MISYIISRTVIMVFGTLYPAYASYKAVRTRDVRQYVKWMMYWIVFAIFNCIETFTDIFLSWFPFYYELKILLVIWLLAPATKGSSILYRKFVHPTLSNKEQEIDEYISKAKEQSYKQVLDLGTRGVSAIMQTAIKSGGGLVNQIKKSYSLSDLTDGYGTMDDQNDGDRMDSEPRLSRNSRSRRNVGSSAGTSTLKNTNAGVYYSQLDIRADSLDSIPSEDLSSGYSSGDAHLAASVQSLRLQQQGRDAPLQRAASLTRAKPTRVTRSTGVTIVRKGSTTNAEEPSQNHLETETPSSASEEDFQDTLDASAGEKGSSVPNVLSPLANEAIVQTQSSENAVMSSTSNTIPLNHNVIGSADNVISSICNQPFRDDNDALRKVGDEMNQVDLDDQMECIVKKAENTETVVIVDTVRDKLEQITNVLENIEKIEEQSLQSISDLSVSDDIRSGKYNKRHAPAVPEHASAITAKLVLKPGVLKPLTNPQDSTVLQVFCHSPKFRRKSCRGDSTSQSGSCSSLSRSRSHSKSPCRPKVDDTSSPFMKLAVLQKKLFGKDVHDKHNPVKGKSWHEGLLHIKMNDLFQIGDATAKGAHVPNNDLD